VTPDTDNPDRFSRGSVLHARPGREGIALPETAGRRTLTVDTVRGETEYPIVSFREIPSREEAEGIRGYLLEIPSSELPPLGEDEFYPFDLVGLAVRDSAGRQVGEVGEVIHSPAHPLLTVKSGSGQETLVPFVEAAVTEVLLDEGYLVVGDGFLDQALDTEEEASGGKKAEQGSGTKDRG